MGNKLRALAWEEFRVGGAIAAAVSVVGVLLQLSFRFAMRTGSVDRDAFMFFAFYSAPLGAALLLILSPDYSGHMTSGASRRVLRLPVPVWTIAGVSLAARIVFVIATGLCSFLIADALFDDAPSRGALVAVALVFLVAQVFDWLRTSISGLSSLLLLLILASIVGTIAGSVHLERPVQMAMGAWLSSPGASLAVLVTTFVICYAVSIPVLRAARMGWRVGVPEIWEWPRRVTLSPVRSRRFSSPIGAQVWLELRQTGWILPTATVCITGIAALMYGTWSLAVTAWFWEDQYVWGWVVGAAPSIAIVLAAAAQSGQGSITGFRQGAGRAEYPFVRPLTDSQYAGARVIANGVSLALALTLMLVTLVAVPGRLFFAELMPRAVELGLANYRDVVWIALSRIFLIGLVAWVVLGAATRLTLYGVAGGLLIAATGGAEAHYTEALTGAGVLFMVWLYLIVFVLGTYAIEWRRGLLSVRACLGWGICWALVAWLIHGGAHAAIEAAAPPTASYLVGVVSSVGLASIVAFPYAAFARDFRLKRHGGMRAQDKLQHQRARDLRHLPRRIAWASGAVAALAVVWLGWPAPAAWKQVWHHRGWPVTLSELDAWYPSVPDDENAALDYLKIWRERNRLDYKFRVKRSSARAASDDGVELRKRLDRILIHRELLGPTELISAETWDITVQYWNEVVRRTAASLERAASHDFAGSRYPIDLTLGDRVRLDHIGPNRELSRDLHVEALYRAVEGDPERASEAVLAMVALANSLSEEPLLISQFSRLGELSVAANSIEDVMNRALVPEAELVRLQEALNGALPPPTDELAVDRGFIGDLVVASARTDEFLAATSRTQAGPVVWVSSLPIAKLLVPQNANEISMSVVYLLRQDSSRSTNSDLEQADLRVEDYFRASSFISPALPLLFPSLSSIYQSEWRVRMKLHTATTAIAVERYRLAHARLPDRLADLVPDFMEAVPRDYFANDGATLRYRAGQDEGFVVYSLGVDADDDLGRERESGSLDGDIAFTVAPMAFRLGPHIAESAE